MPKNVMKLIKPNPHHSRNDFDLSHRHCYTMNFGELLPVSFVETVPGDHIKVSIANLCRAMPLVTSPFLRAKQHFDVWFVAYKDMWHNFDSFITQRYDPVSSALQAHLFCPHMNYGQMKTDFAAIGTKVDVADRPLMKGVEKLWKLCGYGKMSLPAVAGDNNFAVNPFRILAYNYIWYNEYRNKYYDDGSLHVPSGQFNVAQLFNCDALPCSTNANSELRATFGSGYYNGIFQMRYRQWKKDLYTGQLPSTQFGAVSTVSSSNLLSQLKFIYPDGTALTGKHVLSTNAENLNASSIVTDGQAASQWAQYGIRLQANSVTSSVDVLSLRKATALQVWRENALRAGNRVEDNMRAHYGVDSDFRDHRPTYLGSVDAPLNIGDIDATAQTGSGTNQALGSIVGKGLSSLSNKVFEFDAKDFGVIVVLHSILPEAEYNASGVDRMNQLLESEDFFTPEFENLGLEGVPLSTFYHVSSSSGGIPMGYAPRYYGYKTKLDKCFGQLETGGNLSPWCSPRADVDQILAQVPTAYPLRNLYVDPSLFDNNFQVAIANSDQFIVDTYFDVDAVRPMSVMGLPLE